MLDRLDDILIARTAAKVASDPVADFLFAGIGYFVQQSVGAHDHAGRTEPALQTVLLHEGLLYGVQLAILSEPLDRQDLAPFGLYGEHRARLHRQAIDIDGTGSAVRGFTTDVRAGVLTLLAQGVYE